MVRFRPKSELEAVFCAEVKDSKGSKTKQFHGIGSLCRDPHTLCEGHSFRFCVLGGFGLTFEGGSGSGSNHPKIIPTLNVLIGPPAMLDRQNEKKHFFERWKVRTKYRIPVLHSKATASERSQIKT